MAKKNKPDKLAQEVSQAIAANMSYGKWKAMQPRADIEKQDIPDGMKACEHCGTLFKIKSGGKRFCSVACRDKSYFLRTGRH